jgi:hypothetical protein
MQHQDHSPSSWQAFIAGPVYTDDHIPWRADPAFAEIATHPGLRDSIGGRSAPALIQALGLVRAIAGIDLLEVMSARRPARGLCLGFGMNSLEPYDLLQVCRLDQVHAYEWIAEQVIEAAQTLQALQRDEPCLPRRIRLHHGTLSDLCALTDASIQVIYTANVFTWEVPMMPETFSKAIQEVLRVLANGGVVLSRGSAGRFEAHLAPHGRLLLPTAHLSVFQKGAPA